MDIVWTTRAELTYYDEVDFVFNKWNIVEVEKFIKLVDGVVLKLVEQPDIGRVVYKEFRKLVISRQTSLFYKVLEDKIELSFFWNNKKSSKELKKFLK